MRHPVTFLSEVAEAVNKTGEVNVELFAGFDTVTLTDADANIGSKLTHRTMESFHRITCLLLKKILCAAVGTSEVNCATGGGFAFCVLFQGICADERIEWGGQPSAAWFFILRDRELIPGLRRQRLGNGVSWRKTLLVRFAQRNYNSAFIR